MFDIIKGMRAAAAAAAAAALALAVAALGGASVDAQAAEGEPTRREATIYVIGDSLGQNLHFGLYQAYSSSAEIKVKKYTKVSSGMVREDFYDWVAAAEALAASEPMDAVVMLIGGNDNQPIRVEGRRYRARPLSDDWRAEYADRVATLMSSYTSRNIPMYWLTVPAFKDRKLEKTGRVISEIVREQAEKHGVTLIDIYPMFTDERGRYAIRLVDDLGQRKVVRERDGVHLSVSGALWLGRVLRERLDADLELVLPPEALAEQRGMANIPAPRRRPDPAALASKETEEIVSGAPAEGETMTEAVDAASNGAEHP